MDKASVTSPIDFLKNGLFKGGMGGAIQEILGNTNYKCSERIQKWYDVLCQIMAETSSSTWRSPLSAVNQS